MLVRISDFTFAAAEPSEHRLLLSIYKEFWATNLLTMQQGDGVETEVTWEDQQHINLFGRLNNKFHELEDEIKATKDMADNLEDASNELILADEEEVRYLIGEVFSHVPVDEVETRLDALKEENSQELEKLEQEKDDVLDKMADLKKILYGKFKDSINLEEE